MQLPLFVLQAKMTIGCRGIWVVLWLLLSNSKGMTTACKFHSIQPPIDGQACETQDYINISVTERHHCTLACMRSNECKATVYDNLRSVCTLLPLTCFLLKPRAEHVYQAFQYACDKWVPESYDGGLWVYENPRSMAYFARVTVNDDLVLGKVSDRFHGVLPSGTELEHGGSYEKLVVDVACSVTWVSYDATTKQPIPTGAIIGGFLAATNTPLYLTRLHGMKNNEPALLPSYYNPRNHMAWTEFYGIYNRSTFDLLVVQPPSIIA